MQINGGIWASNEDYYYAEPTIDAIKTLKRIPTIKHKLRDLIRTYRTENHIADNIKCSTPMFFPYEIIDTNATLGGKNVKSLEMLILDIDSGCTIESFVKLNPDFDYYLYSTVNHRVTGCDKFRVVIPLKKAMPIEEAIARKQAIIDRFSIGGKTYLDESFLNRGRGFVIPVELEFFTEHESKAGFIFDLEVLPKTDFIPATKSKLALEGFSAQDGIPEIETLASLYKNSSEDCHIEVNNNTYPRNVAFFWIHVEIAKYRPTEVYQKQLAVLMNWDNCRNTVNKTVEAARKYCKSINLSALNAKSDEYWSEVKTNDVEYLKVSDIEVHKGKKHLLTATTGTGKTTLFLDEKFAHKVIFAVPINIIGQQEHSKYGYPFLKGTTVSTPTEDKLICTYNYLVELLRVGVPEDYIIVLDEFHRVVSDDFRTGTLSELVDLIGASQNTIFCLSGTFDPSLFGIFKFDYHFNFEAIRPVREVQVWNTVGSLEHALIHFLNGLSLDTNNLVLFDDKNLLKQIKEALPHVNIVTKDDKDFVERLVNPEFLNGRVTGTILTTQVLMEGINIHDLDNIVVVAKKHYGKEQIVQFFARDRDRSAKCHIIRKPIKDSEVYIPDSDKEKEYQNQIFDEVINRIGLGGMKLIGLKDSDKLLRTRKTEIYINCLYAPIKQKQAMDRANFKNLDLSQYGYELLGAKSLDGKPIQALNDVKKIRSESEQAEYESAIDLILSGFGTSDFPELRGLIAQLKKQGIEQIREICLDKNEVQAYSERFSYFDERLEQEIYQTFGVGKLYSTKECKDFLANFVGQRSFARVHKNNHIKVFRRYFQLTQIRPSSKREGGLELTKVREIGVLERASEFSSKV